MSGRKHLAKLTMEFAHSKVLRKGGRSRWSLGKGTMTVLIGVVP